MAGVAPGTSGFLKLATQSRPLGRNLRSSIYSDKSGVKKAGTMKLKSSGAALAGVQKIPAPLGKPQKL